MTWNDLDGTEKTLYRWSHRRSCGIWNTSRDDGMLECPVLRAQLCVQPNQNQAAYYPEMLAGNPRSRVWVMAINPGGGQLPGDPCRASCPNALDPLWRHMSAEQYANHYLRYYYNFGHDRMWNIGNQIAAAMNMEAEREGEDSFAILNVVHCKCRHWSDVPEEQEASLWSTCGKQTFEMLRHWRPRFVFCIRRSILEGWLPWCARYLGGATHGQFRGGIQLGWPEDEHTDLVECWSQGFWPSHEAIEDAARIALERM